VRSTTPPLRRAIAIVVMAGQLGACTSWRVETLSPAEVIREQQPGAVRIERTDGHHEVWYQPEVHGDTLIGWWNAYAKTPDRALPLAQIKQVSTNHVSPAKTTVLGVTLGAMFAVIIALATWDGPLGGCCGQ